MAANKFVKGMLIGALVGGALTLLDKETREDVLKKGKNLWENLGETVKNPKETVGKIKGKVEQIKENYVELRDELKVLAEKANEFMEAGEEAAKLLLETKEVFTKEEA